MESLFPNYNTKPSSENKSVNTSNLLKNTSSVPVSLSSSSSSVSGLTGIINSVSNSSKVLQSGGNIVAWILFLISLVISVLTVW